MSDPAKSSAAPADDAAGAVDEFAHIPRPTTRHPLIAIGGALLAVYLVFHLRHDLRYALSSDEPVEAGAARTSFGPGAESAGAALENRFMRVAGTPDRESALEIDTKGSWVFSQFFRVLGTGDRLFLHRRENPLPAARAESEVFEGRLVRFGELPFADSIRAYFAKHVTATHFFAPEAFARAVADRAGSSAGLGLVDRNGDAVRLAGDETIALEIARPERVQIGLPRTRFPTEAEARAAVATRGGEVLVARGLVRGASPAGPDAGPLSAAPPAPERWTFVVGFPAARRQAALDEIGDLDHLAEIRDARETITARVAELAAAPGGIAVRRAGAAERRLGTGELGAVHTLAPVVIPDDAYLLVEGDRPHEHVATVFLALILVVFATVNVVGLILKPAMTLRIHDTRAGRKVVFEPLVPGKVGIYSCGITVYDFCHVGHARMMVAFDVIVRHLRASGYAVRFVRNVTDVDDKIIRRAEAEKRSAADLARDYTEKMEADLRALDVRPADVEPRATEHIAEVIDIIRRLEERGLAYPAEGDVYYAVAGFLRYGQLSGQSTEDLRAGARIEVGEQKHSPLDFALWKAAKPGEPFWESPWGPGRPGWHIECSAMAHRYLGEPFDIHGGGADLIFPHHENEIAQSEGAFGDRHFARHWLHSGMVNFAGEKMSKSLGNVVTIRAIAQAYDLEALRLLFLGVHYRSPVGFEIAHDASGRPEYPDLEEAEKRLDYFYTTLQKLAAAAPTEEDDGGPVVAPADRTLSSFQEAMDDDFNTAAAIGHLSDAFLLANRLLDEPQSAAKDVRRRTLSRLRRDLRKCGETLGIFQREPSAFLTARRDRLCARRGIDAGRIEGIIKERAAARAGKDFGRADEIRKSLREEGIELMDSPTGTTWRVV